MFIRKTNSTKCAYRRSIFFYLLSIVTDSETMKQTHYLIAQTLNNNKNYELEIQTKATEFIFTLDILKLCFFIRIEFKYSIWGICVCVFQVF